MIGSLITLIVIGALAWIVASVVGRHSAPEPGRPGARQVVRFGLMAIVVVVVVIGVSGLLRWLLERGTILAGDESASLARSLAFTSIAGPAAFGLWWTSWHRATDADRSMLPARIYLAVLTTVALVVGSASSLVAVADGIDGRWNRDATATGVVWLAVWAWHRWMTGSIARPTIVPVLGAGYGLVMGSATAVAALGPLFRTVVQGGELAGDPWWVFPAQSGAWAIAGAAVWWIHWRGGAASDTRRAARVLIAGVGVGGGALLGVSGGIALLWSLSAWAILGGHPNARDVGSAGLAGVIVGSIVWSFHHRIASARTQPLPRTRSLVESAVGLVAAAAGIGMLIDAALAPLADRMAGTDARSLALTAASAILVGGTTWWWAWRPRSEPDDPGSDERMLYLLVVFGGGALAALVTSLVLGFRLFEAALDPPAWSGLIDRIRAPIGLLTATGLVAGYHYPVWRRERQVTGQPRIRQLVLLSPGPIADDARRRIEQITGARLTLWPIAGETAPSVDDIVEAVHGHVAERIVVVADGSRLEVHDVLS